MPNIESQPQSPEVGLNPAQTETLKKNVQELFDNGETSKAVALLTQLQLAGVDSTPNVKVSQINAERENLRSNPHALAKYLARLQHLGWLESANTKVKPEQYEQEKKVYYR